MFGIEHTYHVRIHQFSRWHNTVSLIFLCLQQTSINIVNSGYPNKRGFWAPYQNEVIMYHMSHFNNGSPYMNKINKNCLIYLIKLYIMLLKRHLEFERRIRGSCVIFRDMVFMLKKTKWQLIQQNYIILSYFQIILMNILLK